MFWSLGSGTVQLTAFQCLVMWLMANGHVPAITLSSNPIWIGIWLVLLPIWSAFHFHWGHRLLHVPIHCQHVHALHHRNVNIGPRSGPMSLWQSGNAVGSVVWHLSQRL